MVMALDQWQERLEAHFEALARKRANSGFPLFALEHGLGDEELEEVSSLLRSRLKANFRLLDHWLLWVVYATERGYNYAGDEYWRSFEEKTPHWEFGNRYEVAPWFIKFRKAYNGVEPSGAWASHFKIIAWPITHAILPQYLQQQFARALYDLRFRLAGLNMLKPADIGRLLAANAHHVSTRFEEFLQQEELAGRIVMALMDVHPEGKEPIYRPTLQRIVRDLEKVGSAREWLKEAQRVVADRFAGIGRGTGPPKQRPISSSDDDAEASNAQPDIRPTLLLRHTGSRRWSVLMDVPSFKDVAALNPDIQVFLRRTRCRLNGADDMKAAGWVLSGNRKGILKSWPNAARPLIEFEQSHGLLDHLLNVACRLSTGPVWLFRVSSDGTAKEIVGRIVRPGSDYIVVTTGASSPGHPSVSQCQVDCSGITAFRVSVASNVTADDIAWLQRLGLQVARTIRVWPAGLPARDWDGEGNSEWLTTEAPCFGIVHDHPVDAYTLRLDGGAETIIEAGKVGAPTFVRLPRLPAGMHSLTVKAKRADSLREIVQSPPAEGFIQLRVREPEPWIPGAVLHSGLIVTLDPHDADLDEFWANHVKLSVSGPESYTASFWASLEARDGRQILSEQVGEPMGLPVTPSAWTKRFDAFVKPEGRAWAYLEAARGKLKIKAEALGEYVLRFEHDVLPLRWVPHRSHDRISARLVDDTGTAGEPELYFRGMTRPAKQQSQSPVEAYRGITIEAPGGLLVAQHGTHRDAVVISVGLVGSGLRELGVSPDFGDLDDNSWTILRVLQLLDEWNSARLSGFLAEVRRQQVAEGLSSKIYERICGPDWVRAEADFRRGTNKLRALDTLQRAVDRHAGFASVLRRDYAKMDGNAESGARWYGDLAAQFGVCADSRLCNFALKLASQPQLAARSAETDCLLEKICQSPAILRGARLLALLSASETDKTSTLLPRWKW